MQTKPYEKERIAFAILSIFTIAALFGYLYSERKMNYEIEHSYQSDGWKRFYNRQITDAIEAFGRQLRHDNANYYALAGLGWSYFRLKNYETAALYFERAAGHSANDDFALRGLGRSYYHLYAKSPSSDDFFTKSEAAFKRAITVRKSSDSFGMLGRLYLLRGKYDSTETYYTKAEHALLEASQLDQKNAELLNLLGFTLYAKSARFNQAALNASKIAEIYQQSLSISPTWQAYAGIGLMQLRFGNISLAFENLNHSLQISENLDAHMGIGMSLLMSKRYDGAVVYFANLSKKYPDNLRVMRWLGVSLRMDGDFLDSRDVFERILSLDGTYLHAYLNLMYLYSTEGDLPQAKVMLDRALAIEPDLLKLNDRKEIVECLYRLNSIYSVSSIVSCYDIFEESTSPNVQNHTPVPIIS